MNRNLAGEWLSIDELIAIALGHDLITESDLVRARGSCHSAATFRSQMLSLTAKTRNDMFWRGELTLNTRTSVTS